MRVVKTCACGEEFDSGRWRTLRYVGEQRDEVEVLELRQCQSCNSTLARERIVVELPG